MPTLSGNDGKNNWNAGLGMDLIRGYDRVRKLSPEELKYLYVYLAYPENSGRSPTVIIIHTRRGCREEI